MKIFQLTILLTISCFSLFAQTDGISYQAVIIDPNPKEIPGVDLKGNILPNTVVAIRFTILNQNNNEEYQEVQMTQTDAFGIINLMIGQGEPGNVGVGDFTLIDWDGTPRSLQVEVDFEGAGTSFVDLNRQELTFVPYAFHRNITASGNATIDGTTDLNGVLTVQGPTDLNNSLDVTNGNPTYLSGRLTVDSASYLGDQLIVDGMTNLNDSVNVNNQRPSYFSGDITVDGTSTFNGSAEFNAPVEFVEVTVNGPSNLNGQVTVRANMDSVGNQDQYQAYPLLVEGSRQGIAIKVNENRSIRNNYISFWDNNQMWGRIEGQTLDDLEDDAEYKLEEAFKITDVVLATVDEVIAIAEIAQAGVELGASSSSSTACAGLGACVTAPIPSLIVSSGTNLALKIANGVAATANLVKVSVDLDKFYQFHEDNIGVTYQSGAGDYAEWLPKKNPSEVFNSGDVVGLKDGFISKNTLGADKVMIISTRPMALGNMPQKEKTSEYEMVAFLGQVPARIIGSVKPGDYVLPSEFGSGFGKAVDPSMISVDDYKKIAGVVWSVKKSITERVNIVNVAVGLNYHEMAGHLQKQEKEIQDLKSEISGMRKQREELDIVLADLVPGFEESMASISNHTKAEIAGNDNRPIRQPNELLVHAQADDIVYYEVTDDEISDMIRMAKKIFLESGEKTEDHPFWSKMENEPEYEQEIRNLMKSKFEKAVHFHKSYNEEVIHKH